VFNAYFIGYMHCHNYCNKRI